MREENRKMLSPLPSFLTLSSNDNIVIDPVEDLFPDDKVRGHSLALNMHKPRSSSISLSKSKEEYHVCIQKISNKMDEDNPIPKSNNNKVEDTTQDKGKNLGSKAADNVGNTLHLLQTSFSLYLHNQWTDFYKLS